MIMTQLRSVFFLSIGLMGLFALQPFAMELARDGQSQYAVAVAVRANAAERFAAEELTNFLYQITGAVFPVVEETGLPTGTPALYVGPTEFTAGQGVRTEDLGPETWVLRTVGDNLILTGGRPRGTLYAVYELLDTYGGCRWITHDLEIVPKNSVFTLPELNKQGEPAFAWRETTLYPRHDGGPDSGSQEAYAKFLVRNRYNGGAHWLNEPRFGFAVRFGNPSSGHTFFPYQQNWKDVKPEYFAMLEDGTRAPRPINALGYDFCLTNPELRDRMYAQLLTFIAEDRAESAKKGLPPPTHYALSQNDTSSRYCRCPLCMAIAEREGSYSGVMIDFVNELADRIANTHPEIMLVTDAYQFTKRPPKSLRPRANVIVRLPLLDREYGAAELADVLRPITAPTNLEARQITEGWMKIMSGAQFWAWDYAQFRLPFRHPYDATAKIMQNLDYWHALGIRRAFIEQAGVDLSFRPMRDWVFFRKSLNPKLDNDQLASEFMSGYFGPAAAPMRRYYDRLAAETVAGDKPYINTPPAVNPYLTPEFFTQVNTWLDEAEALAQHSDNRRYLRNVQYERVPVDSAMLHLWHRYATDPTWTDKKEEVLQRYEKNKRLLIASWATSVDVWVNSGQNAIESELIMLRQEPPAQFVGRNAATRLLGIPLPGMSRATRVEDSAAAGEHAVALGQGRPDEQKLPLLVRIHDEQAQENWGTFTLDTAPQDEAYHWYHVGTAPLNGHCILWFNVYLVMPLSWAAVPPPSNEKEVWVSLKFTGPAYVKSSTQPNQILIDQVVAVPPVR